MIKRNLKGRFIKGHIPWNKGKHWSEATKKKIGKARMGRFCKANNPCWKGGKSKCIDCEIILNRYQGIRCRKCQNQYNRGKNHPNWKGGITLLTKQIRNHSRYKQWIFNIFERDNFTCQKCEVRGGKLHAHHKPPNTFSNLLKKYHITTLTKALNCKELWNIDNGITMCRKCHKSHDKFTGQSGVKGIVISSSITPEVVSVPE